METNEIKRKLDDHENILYGNRETGEPGLAGNFIRLMNDIYGEKEDRDKGMKSRLELLERDKRDLKKWVAGAMAVGGAFSVGVWEMVKAYIVPHVKP